MSNLTELITSSNNRIRNTSLDDYCKNLSLNDLLKECESLESFWRNSSNLYERVRALFFLYAIYRFHLPEKGIEAKGLIPFEGYDHFLNRRYIEAVDVFRSKMKENGVNDGISSALARTYQSLGFQTLADQVRRSVRSINGNNWMFRIGHPDDHPLRIKRELYANVSANNLFPVLHEQTPVRMDLSHSGWSDIFFLGMDFPQGARVLNVSVNLSVLIDGENNKPKPPVETYFRIIDKPLLRLTSVDLGVTSDINSIDEIFDFAKDYLGLLKAAVIASGIIPPGMEGADQPLSQLLAKLIKPGYGIEIASKVNNIPKGSRLAVSTNLLASLISICMRATGQIKNLTGELEELDRRIVAARAILGEWLAGSGGGWQDSGGVWPGMKLIEGVKAIEGNPEFGISEGCLLPKHKILDHKDVSKDTRKLLQNSLIMVHGGMAQDVGPILEMVTEKYLLRSKAEWKGRKEAINIFDSILDNLKKGDVQSIGKLTQKNFFGPIQTIIPWATNFFTESLIKKVEEKYGPNFWGFWMMGGMSGGGMGFIFNPKFKKKAQSDIREMMSELKNDLKDSVPFAMEPVVYDFEINEKGSFAELLENEKAIMPGGYYSIITPGLIKKESRELSAVQRTELEELSNIARTDKNYSGLLNSLFDIILPQKVSAFDEENLPEMLKKYGFDSAQHEQIRSDLKCGRIGLAQNKLSVSTQITDVSENDVTDISALSGEKYNKAGLSALKKGEIAVVSFAGGIGSRWTKGAGVVKALNPFSKLNGKHKSFIEIHLAKSNKTKKLFGQKIQHVFTTSYLTHNPIENKLNINKNYNYKGNLYVSRGKFIGLRMIPMKRDLRYLWEELPQQLLDEQAQKVLESLRGAFLKWVENMGQGSDYTDNLPHQCLHPVGHWYEIPNMLINGTLHKMISDNPNLKYLMSHNIDTLGANLDPSILGFHILNNKTLTMEVINKRIEDRGGGLAKVNGNLRLVEGLALPKEEIEFDLTFYNTLTSWININKLLELFSLNRDDLGNEKLVLESVRDFAAKMPTYITIKDVKKRWGKGQEDIYPVAQFEKLWGDMTALPNVSCQYLAVPRFRGQQLKEPAQLDSWLRDGSAAYIDSICEWE
ncbi:MAG: UTP--glucose-1-phosphate uridylyltransferase [Ignavibacteriaceae bacterium]